MTIRLMTLMQNPSFRTGTFGFLAGSIIPIMFTNFYLIPYQTLKDQNDIRRMKNSVGLMNWQVKKLERLENPHSALNSESYQDGLYWAGF